VLVLGYYNCPLVCPLILERLLGALNQVDYTLGRDFQVVVISFDPRNTPAMAAANKKQYLAGYRRGVTPEAEAGWAFHTSDEASVKRLADAIGFEYRFIKESGEYSHPVALTFLSPQGKVTRYVYGFDYEPRTFKLSLLEASSGSIARSVGDRFLWFCYHYDPKTGKYTLAAFRVMQLGALLVLCGVAGMVIVLRLGELRRARKANESAAPAGGVTAAGQSA
jgi:protein SCO1/2